MFKLKKLVLASECDSQTNLSYIGTLQIIEDSLTSFMGSMKLDGITLSKKYGATWVFTKNKIDFRKPVKWGDKIIIKCFFSLISLATVNVTTLILNDKKEIVCVSTVQMCALNFKENKVFKLSQIKNLTNKKVISGYELTLDRFDEANYKQIDNITVKFSSIDNLHHTNNIEYIRFILNTYSVKELTTKPIKTLQIDYINQTYEGNKLDILKAKNKDFDQFNIKNGDQTAVLCKITY